MNNPQFDDDAMPDDTSGPNNDANGAISGATHAEDEEGNDDASPGSPHTDPGTPEEDWEVAEMGRGVGRGVGDQGDDDDKDNLATLGFTVQDGPDPTPIDTFGDKDE